MQLKLFIGNKAYSSWSLRPWILLTHFGIPFEEAVIPLYQPTTEIDIQRVSPNAKVPVLHADGLAICESLAIIEFLAESVPDKPIWPKDRRARALARSLSCEMHAGFSKLRQSCPTQFRRAPKPIAIDHDVRAEVDRIEAAWAGARHEFGADGPFLFGAFSAADAMFAPVVNRFQVYAIEVRPETQAYMDAIAALPAWQAWIDGAKAEAWVVEHYDAM